MYIPESFKTKDREELIEFISEWSYGDLITTIDGRINISYVPFVFDHENMLLYGHLLAQDLQHLKLDQADDLVVIFKEPTAYLPKVGTHPSHPKWSFQSVHIKGRPEFVNKIQLLTVVDGLTRRYDKQFGNPWGGRALSEEEIDAMLKEIVGIRIHIEEIIGKYKRHHACYVDGQYNATLPNDNAAYSSKSLYVAPPLIIENQPNSP